jgi:capsular polysaccharide biosynthesis protein
MSLDTSYARRVRPAAPANRCTISGEYVFGGLFYPEFGHFISETVPNLVAAAANRKRFGGTDILMFLPPNWMENPKAPPIAPFHRFFLDRIGIDVADLHFITDPSRVESLLVGRSPALRKYRYAPWVLEEMDRCFAAPAGEKRRIYMSRSKWPVGQRLVNEKMIEALFLEAGYDILHPQDMTLEDQLTAVWQSSVMAGGQGTALHWSLFAPDCKAVLSLGWRSPVQKGISRSRNQTYLNPQGKKTDRKTPRLRAFSETEIRHLIQNIEGHPAQK